MMLTMDIGLPRILEGSLPEYLASTTGDEDGVDSPDEWRMFGEYLERGTRININVRQGESVPAPSQSTILMHCCSPRPVGLN